MNNHTSIQTKQEDTIVLPKREISIPDLNIHAIQIEFVSISRLVTNKKNPIDMKKMREKQEGKVITQHAPLEPFQRFAHSMYWVTPMPTRKIKQKDIDNATFGFPANGIKRCGVDAMSYIKGLTKVQARGTFFTVEDELVTIESETPPNDRGPEPIPLKAGGMHIVYRGEWPEWRMNVDFTFDASIITAEQLVNIYKRAGYSVGLGDKRPQNNGTWGRFTIGNVILIEREIQ